MRNEQGTVLETLVRIQGFLDTNGELLKAVNTSGARAKLDDVVKQLGAHAVLQDKGARTSRGETERQRVLRVALRDDHMAPISLIAKQRLRDKPEFASLTLPARNVGHQRLLAAAKAMAEAAEPHAPAFVEEGLPPQFVGDLRQATETYAQSLVGRNVGREARATGTAGLMSEEKRARKQIRILNAMVRKEIRNNDALLGAWRAASHIGRKPGRVAGRGTEPVSTGADTAGEPVKAA
jgi:hypothetical protein